MTVTQLERVFAEAGTEGPLPVREAHPWEIQNILKKIDLRMEALKHNKDINKNLPGGHSEPFQSAGDDSDDLLNGLQEKPNRKRPAGESVSALEDDSEHPLQSTLNQGGARFDGNSGSLTPIDSPIPQDTLRDHGAQGIESNPNPYSQLEQSNNAQPLTQIETPSLSTNTASGIVNLAASSMGSTAAAGAGGRNSSGQVDCPFPLGYQGPVTIPHLDGIGFDVIFENNVRLVTPAWNLKAVSNPYNHIGKDGAIMNLGAGKDFLYQPMGQEIPYDTPIVYCPPSDWAALPFQTHKCRIKYVEVKAVPISSQVFFTTGSTDPGPVTTEYDKYILAFKGGNQRPVMWSRMAIEGAVTTANAMSPIATNYAPPDYKRLKEKFWGPIDATASDGIVAQKFLCQNVRRELETMGGYFYDGGGSATPVKGINLEMEGLKKPVAFDSVKGQVILHERYTPKNGLISSPWFKDTLYPNAPQAHSFADNEQTAYDEALKSEVALMLQLSNTAKYARHNQIVPGDDQGNYLSHELFSHDMRDIMFTKVSGAPLGGFDDMYGNWAFGKIDSDITNRVLQYNYAPFRTKNGLPLKAWTLADRTVGAKTYHYHETLSLQTYHSKIERGDSFLPAGKPDNDRFPKPAPVPPSLIISMEAIQQKDYRGDASTWMSAACTWGVSFKMVIECSYSFPKQVFTEPNLRCIYAKYGDGEQEDEALHFIVRKALFGVSTPTVEKDVYYQIQSMQPPELSDFHFQGHIPKTQKTGMGVIPGDPTFTRIIPQSQLTAVPTCINLFN